MVTTERDVHEQGVRVVVVNMGSWRCAYLGIPAGHPLAGFDYDRMPLDVHGGLTYAGPLDREGWWFYGWDYAHLGDLMSEWTSDAVFADAQRAIYDFNRLARLAEEVAARAR